MLTTGVKEGVLEDQCAKCIHGVQVGQKSSSLDFKNRLYLGMKRRSSGAGEGVMLEL